MYLTAISVLLPLLMGASQVVQAAELSTLFTTPAERQLINSNRYKSDDGTIQQPVKTETAPQPVQRLVREEVTREYKVSGITVSSDGPHTVWINSLAYEDGEQLEDRSRIKVMVGDEIRVRITTPDGKHYYATSGELLEVTYLTPIEN
ncbi:MAG: hypothetical protein WBO58_17790 [Gammaproteobacteria bacterium]